MHHLRSPRILTLLAFFLFVLLPATAPAQDWQARLHGQWVSSSLETFDGAELGDGSGFYLGAEKRLNERWGVEVGIGRSELESEETIQLDFFGLSIATEIGNRVEWMPLTLAANYHFPTGGDVDIYIAPRIGWAFMDDLEIRTNVDVGGGIVLPGFPIVFTLPDFGPTGSEVVSLDLDDAFLYGLRFGLERPFGDGTWSFSAALSLDVIELESDVGSFGDLDPLSVGIGVSRRF